MLPLFLLLFSYDLDAVKAEPNPERRADLALDNANAALDRARNFYKDADYDKSKAAVIEVQDSVELCHESLKSTGKDPQKNVKQFKKVEMRMQMLVRRLNGFSMEVSVEDRPTIKKAVERVQDINEEIVTGIFTKRK